MKKLKNQTFKNVRQFDGYLVSNYGRIYSEKSNCFMKPYYDLNNYAYVNITVDGVAKTLKIHRAVAEAFIREVKPNEVVHHIDCNSTNNSLGNLMILDRTAHLRLHKAGKPLSEDHKRKIRESRIRTEAKKKNRLEVNIDVD